ncbi:sulfate transporter family protein [Amorphus orientalis]|uniref:CysZ protein n=1 Tax=Amorphus orientalis TaxID=649198 RepID=A0AAE4ATQ8_9HYPH|nr:sulfate transporter family protein [Amorphus orientalis]MDQ0315209.1 CysZ protein [Amorphus orientalis]
MLSSASRAFSEIFSQPFRPVFLKTLGITIALLIAVWLGVQAALTYWVTLPYGWMETVLSVLTGIGMVFGLAILAAPVSAAVAGLFQDEIAGTVERLDYAGDRPGTDVPMMRGLWHTVKFTGVVILGNILALLLLLVPVVNIAAFFLVNGYLLGREYFEAASMRFRSEAETKRLRQQHSFQIFLAGLIIAGVLAVPILNLVTPIFATAFMVHLHKRIAAGERM